MAPSCNMHSSGGTTASLAPNGSMVAVHHHHSRNPKLLLWPTSIAPPTSQTTGEDHTLPTSDNTYVVGMGSCGSIHLTIFTDDIPPPPPPPPNKSRPSCPLRRNFLASTQHHSLGRHQPPPEELPHAPPPALLDVHHADQCVHPRVNDLGE